MTNNRTVAELELLLAEAEANTEKAAEVVAQCEKELRKARRDHIACADTEYGFRVDLKRMKMVEP